MKTLVVRLASLALVCCSFLHVAAAQAQDASNSATGGEISGTVTGAGAGVAGAQVSIVELRRVVATNDQGVYRFASVASGRYTLTVQRLGFAAMSQTVTVAGAPVTTDFALAESVIPMDPVTVTATGSAIDDLHSPLPSSTLSEQRLRRQTNVSIGNAVSELPGVNSVTTGGQIGKPMIRGLFGARVLVMEDGNRLEDYSWSEEDAPSADARLAQRIEVIRGPASVLYGSDALNGVVNVLSNPLPDARDGAPKHSGGAEVYGATNNTEIGTALKYEGASGAAGWRIFGVGRFAEDLRTPDGKIENTGFGAVSGEAAFGVRRDRSDWGLRYAHNGGEYKLLEANGPPPGAGGEDEEEGPERKAMDDRVQFHGAIQRPEARYEAKVQYQRHSLIEVSDEGGAAGGGGPKVEATAFDLLLNSTSVDLMMHHTQREHVRGTIGLNGLFQTNDTRGPIALIPAATTQSGALYAFEEASQGQWSLLAGARVDFRHLAADANDSLGMADDSRDYTAGTGDVGLVYRPAPNWAVSANVGRSWRAPTLFELYANGPHLAEARFEIGDASLDPEYGLNLDGGIRFQSPRLHAELAGYFNTIDNFIFVQPTSSYVVEGGDSLQVFRHVQSDAEIKGGEFDAEYEATDLVSLRGRADLVRGTEKDSDEPLPLISPARVTAGLELHPKLSKFGYSHFGVEYQHVYEQTRLNPEDYPTGPYDLVNLDAGFQPVLFGHRIGVDLTALNIADKAYKNFLSRYKSFALDPGRNIIIRLSTML